MDNEARVLQEIDIYNSSNISGKLESLRRESLDLKSENQNTPTRDTCHKRSPLHVTSSENLQTAAVNKVKPSDSSEDFANESSAESNELEAGGSAVVSPSGSSLYLSTSASPTQNRAALNVSSADSSLYYSVYDDNTSTGELSGTESDLSADVTVVPSSASQSAVSNTSTSELEAVTPVNTNRRQSDLSSNYSSVESSGSTAEESSSSGRRYFDKTLAVGKTVIYHDEDGEAPCRKISDLIGQSEVESSEFVSGDHFVFDKNQHFNSPLRRPTFSIGLVSSTLPLKEPLLQPQRSHSTSECNESEFNSSVPKVSNTVVEEFEEQIANQTFVCDLESSFFGCKSLSDKEQDAFTEDLKNESFELNNNTPNVTVCNDSLIAGFAGLSVASAKKGKNSFDNDSSSIVEGSLLEETKMTSAFEQDDFDFEAVADPFKSSNKMMTDSPPLPRKTAEIDYDNIDFEAIENPFASSKKMMMNTPPDSDPAPINTFETLDAMPDDSSETQPEKLPEMNGSATITRPSAHSRTKTKVPPHKARRSANTKLSSDSEVVAKLTGSGDASQDVALGAAPQYGEVDSAKKEKVPPPVPKRGSSSTGQSQPAQLAVASASVEDLTDSKVDDTPSTNQEADEFPPPPSEEELKSGGVVEGQNDQEDFDFESVADPFKSSNKMMMDSPPLPRKTVEIDYGNLDFDAIENPFASTKKMMMDSPPESDPAPINNYEPPPEPEPEPVVEHDSNPDAANLNQEPETGAKLSSNEEAIDENMDTAGDQNKNLTPQALVNGADSTYDEIDNESLQLNPTPTSPLALSKSALSSQAKESPVDISKPASPARTPKTVTKPKNTRTLNASPRVARKGSEPESSDKSQSEESTDKSQTDLPVDKSNAQIESEKTSSKQINGQELPYDMREDFFKEFELLRDENKKMKAEVSHLKEEKNLTVEILQEFEDIFAQLCVIKDKREKEFQSEINRINQENVELREDVQSLDQSFDQAMKRFKKARDAIGQYKNNEQILKQELHKAREEIAKEKKMYETLKSCTEEKFTEAETSAQENEKSLRGQIMRLEMEMKRLKMANDALQLSYDQKVKDNKEMNELCENLISKLAETGSVN